MANWRLADSLKKLREQINEEFPNRSKASDGSVGDTSHAARKSDHNPNAQGVVTAIDITHDPRSGCTGDKLAAALIKSRNPRIKYIIWNRRMLSSYASGGTPAWTWRPYSGANAHTHHLHISVSEDKSRYDSKADWNLDFDIAVVQSPESLADSRDTIQNSALVADSRHVSANPLETSESAPEAPLPSQTTTIQETTTQQVAEGAEPIKTTTVSETTTSFLEQPKQILKDKSGSLMNWLVGAGTLSTIGAWLKDNQTLIVVSFISLVVVVLTIYFVNKYFKILEAKIKADKNSHDVEFVKSK